jgi:Na+/proline symporter
LLRLHVNPFDYTILAIYFALVIAIGVIARRAVATSEDFLLPGRSLPAWVTGLAFISANLGAIEILGMAANAGELAKASGININLWMGISMLIVGAFFLAWWRLRPLQREQPQPEPYETGGTGPGMDALQPLSHHLSRRGSAGAGACWG